jgi:hypothetical protein
VPRFFGLTPSNKDLYLEQIFALIYHLGFTYRDAYNCPVWQRFWFINRLKKQFDDMKDKGASTDRGKRTNNGSRGFNKLF